MTPPKAETEETRFWRGQFGDRYIDRNALDAARLQARVALWSRILNGTVGSPPASILEVGANIGVNLRALRALTSAKLFALEPNEKARRVLVDDGIVPASRVKDGIAAANRFPSRAADLVFTSGVLIHIAPKDLLASCRGIHRLARRYVVSVEYFAPHPEEVLYRGHKGRLFKRDFGGFWLDHFPDLRVVDYGFAWQRLTGLDNLTWWLLEKRE